MIGPVNRAPPPYVGGYSFSENALARGRALRVRVFLEEPAVIRPTLQKTLKVRTEGTREVAFSKKTILRRLNDELCQSAKEHHEHQGIPAVVPHEDSSAATVIEAGVKDVLRAETMFVELRAICPV